MRKAVDRFEDQQSHSKLGPPWEGCYGGDHTVGNEIVAFLGVNLKSVAVPISTSPITRKEKLNMKTHQIVRKIYQIIFKIIRKIMS